MKNNLKISLVQFHISENKKENLIKLEKLFSKIIYTDVILLPEMFNTSFLPEKIDLAENMNGPTIKWMKNISKEYNCSVVGTLMIRQNKKIYNRLVWIKKSLEIFTYDKKHLFSIAKEDKYLSKGNDKIIIEQDGWKICPLICYDLRFPAFIRNTENYDVLIFLANWPEKRIESWSTLLKARAIENQCISIGVNRTGKDSNNIIYDGNSKAIDIFGKKIGSCEKSKEEILTVTLNKKIYETQKNKFNFLKDLDKEYFNL